MAKPKAERPGERARTRNKLLIEQSKWLSESDILGGKTSGPDRKSFIYVNNRLEGNALETIDSMTEDMDQFSVEANLKADATR